ncbi:MAG: hypothetical protein KDA93_24945 [Planctomycetaceae bacterium]|nr:hypothetical protein [Planctomycetaceae bacterium]
MFKLLLPNTALRELFSMRARARVRTMWRKIASPKRLVLSTIAVLLPLIWIVNFVASVLLREPFGQETFRNGVFCTGAAYCLWYLLKASTFRPPAAIEWTPAESSLMCGGPFKRADLIRYRLTMIFTATFFKALFASLMLLPELSIWWSGFLGMLLGLAFLDVLRLVAEIIITGVSHSVFLKIRAAMLTIAATAGISASILALTSTELLTSEFPMAMALPVEFIRQLVNLRSTAAGMIFSAPLLPFVEIITAPALSWSLVSWLLLGGSMTFALTTAVVQLDGIYADQNAESIRRAYASIAAAKRAKKHARRRNMQLPNIARLRGAGPIAWRQWLGARKYEVSLVFALGVPAALSSLPLLADSNSINTFLNVASALIFYSFLLLPAALKFDFRRDYDRLPVLKTLPVSPLAIVVGQLAVPVLLATLLQAFVLLFAYIVRPIPFSIVMNALLMVIPLNVMIFGLDNLIYLMFPYRQSEEGLQPFIRATLTFTAKGVLCLSALTCIFFWAVNCRWLSELPVFASLGGHRVLFIIGIWLMMLASGVILTLLSARAFARFDISCDHVM